MSDPPPDDERDRFEALWSASYPKILAYARRRFSEEDARDVAADTFLVAWRRRADLPADDPVPWLYGVARRVASDRRRAAARRSRLTQRLDSQRPAEVGAPPDPEETRLLEALAMLGERDREALLLTGWEDLTPAQAAQALGCSQPAFRVRLHRARRRLRALLAADARALPGAAGRRTPHAPGGEPQ